MAFQTKVMMDLEMIEHPHDEHYFQRYLLGDLPEGERERLQERYFADASLFSRLLSAETDLIDAYGRGELTEEERKRFEQRFGNVRGIDQRLKFAKMLSRAADQHSTTTQTDGDTETRRHGDTETWRHGDTEVEGYPDAPSPGFPWMSSIGPSLGSRLVRTSVFAVAAVITVMAALVLANRWLPSRRSDPGVDLASSHTDSAPARPTAQSNNEVPVESDDNNSRPGAPPITKPEESRQSSLPKAKPASITVLLHEGITRAGGEATQVVLSPATTSLQAQMELPADLQTGTYSSYQAVLQTVAGQEVFRRRGLKITKAGGGASVRVSLPVEVLTTRDYVLLLSGQRLDRTQQFLRGYSFSAIRK